MGSRRAWTSAVVAAIVFAFLPVAKVSAGPIASEFTEETAFGGLTLPTAIEFSADGRVFVGEKSGRVRAYSSVDSTSFTVLTDLSAEVYSYWDRGLLGMALHPDFPSQPYLYLLYTTDVAGFNDACPSPPGATDQGCIANGRLARIQVSATSTQVGTPVVMLDGFWCQQYPSHSVGTLNFGPDGSLYVSAGDGASFTFTDYGQRGNPCGDPPVPAGVNQTLPEAEGGALRSQGPRRSGDLVTYDGTILRIDPMTGSAWPGNPLTGAPRPAEDRIIAYGLRNPFRFVVQPGTGDLFIGDVGQGSWEEINRLANPGSTLRNFGWPCYEGAARQPGYDSINATLCENLYATSGAVTAPLLAYQHGVSLAGCPGSTSSISGLDFNVSDAFPSKYQGALFFSDFSRQCIWAMLADPSGQPDPSQIELFATATPAVDLVFGPDGYLYYVDHLGGRVQRIRPNTTPPPPPPSGDGSVQLPGASGSYIWAPDNDWLDITGDIDMRADIALDDWATNSGKIISKLGHSYEFMLNGTTQGLRIAWYEESGALRVRNSTSPLPVDPEQRIQVRVTLDVDNGTGGHTATFYYRTDTSQALTDHTGWTQLGNTITATGTTSIRPGGTSVTLGAHVNGNSEFWAGNYYRALIINGIAAAGTTAADPDFTTTTQLTTTPPNYTTWQDTPTNTWTLTGTTTYQPGSTSQAPVALLEASPTSGVAPLLVSFDGSGSSDPDSDPLTFAWDLDGDGQFDDATGPTATWTYNEGTHQPALRVSDPDGATDITSTTITVSPSTPPPTGDGSVRLPGASGSYIWAPDNDWLDITGDIDMRADVSLDDWATNSGKFITKLGDSYEFMLNGTTKGIRIAWYEAGGALRIRNSTTPLPVTDGQRIQVRVTLDVDNGTGDHTATFYYRTDTSQALTDHTGWTQLGTPITATGTTNIRQGGTSVHLGAHVNGSQEFWAGNYYRALIINGIAGAGTTAADPDFTTTTQLTSTPPNYTTWQDTPTNTWTLTGTTTYQPGSGDPTNQAPTATIGTPTAATTWAVGETISFSGSGTDPEEGDLPASAMVWSLIMHHCATTTDCHQHPIQQFNGVASGSFVAPDHEYPSHLELRLTVEDSDGASHSSSVLLQPKTVDLTFQTDPSGLSLTVGSVSGTAPFTRTVIVGSTISIAAPSPQTLGSTEYTFLSWSQGGGASQDLVAPATSTTYTASYEANSTPPPNQAPVALLEASPTSGVAPLLVSFDGSGSSDPDSDPLTFAWDLDGDGQFDDATGPTATWTYNEGAHQPTLRVSDPDGATDITSTTITVSPSTPPPSGDGSVRLPGASGSYIWAPDNDWLDITGDIDMRADIALDDWATNSGKIITKLGHSYEFMLNGTTQGLRIAWYEESGALRVRNSTSPLPVDPEQRIQVRVTLDVDNGTGGHTATFYYRTDTSQALTDHTGWTQLGTPITATGTTSIRPGKTQVVLGSHVNGNREFWAGNYYRALIINGIGAAGTTAADPDFTTTTQLTTTPPNYTTWQDTPTNTWTLTGNSTYVPGAE